MLRESGPSRTHGGLKEWHSHTISILTILIPHETLFYLRITFRHTWKVM